MPETQEKPALGEDLNDVRFGEILNDFLDRRARGEAASEAELFARHPEFADELRAALELVSSIRPSDNGIEDLIARGVLARSSDPQYLAELGPYKIGGIVGRGGMGVVLKAHEQGVEQLTIQVDAQGRTKLAENDGKGAGSDPRIEYHVWLVRGRRSAEG